MFFHSTKPVYQLGAKHAERQHFVFGSPRVLPVRQNSAQPLDLFERL